MFEQKQNDIKGSKSVMFVLVTFIFLATLFLFLFLNKDKEEQAGSITNEVTEGDTYQMEGNVYDLLQFSVLPNTRVSGVVPFTGEIEGGYFFEANILINILDVNKNVLKNSHATATSDWMTGGPVTFAGEIDLTGLPAGNAYLEIRNDNPAAPEEGINKSILIPIVIE